MYEVMTKAVEALAASALWCSCLAFFNFKLQTHLVF